MERVTFIVANLEFMFANSHHAKPKLSMGTSRSGRTRDGGLDDTSFDRRQPKPKTREVKRVAPPSSKLRACGVAVALLVPMLVLVGRAALLLDTPLPPPPPPPPQPRPPAVEMDSARQGSNASGVCTAIECCRGANDNLTLLSGRERLGEGVYGRVFRVTMADGRAAVLKEFKPRMAAFPATAEREFRAQLTAASLDIGPKVLHVACPTRQRPSGVLVSELLPRAWIQDPEAEAWCRSPFSPYLAPKCRDLDRLMRGLDDSGLLQLASSAPSPCMLYACLTLVGA